jgi:hypothetical protein
MDIFNFFSYIIYWVYVSFLAMLATSIGCISFKIIDNNKYDNHLFLILSFIIMGFLSFFI